MVTENIFVFPLLQPSYCAALLTRLEHFQRSVPAHLRGRVNSMNNGLFVVSNPHFFYC